MKLTKKQQYGLLLILYISRAGRCTLADVAEELELSVNFLEQVARLLRISGMLRSIRGPGGGYELVGEPTVGEVIYALGTFIHSTKGFQKSSEKRALTQLFSSFSSAIAPVLRRKVSSLNWELAANEVAAMASMRGPAVN